jgi:hypothetical protein
MMSRPNQAGGWFRMLWSIAGFICVFIPLVLGGLVGVWLFKVGARHYAREMKLVREGRVVKAWIVFANENLYRTNPPSMWWNALAVCTLEELPDLDDKLKEWAEGIRDFRPRDLAIHEEYAIDAVLRTQIAYPDPIRIPRRIAGEHEAYFIGLAIDCALLPGHRLIQRHVYCNFYKGPERDDGHARMVAYPEYERGRRSRDDEDD